MAKIRDEALQAEADAEYVVHPVDVVQLEHDGPHQGVDARAHAAAGDNGRLEFFGVEVDVAAGAGLFEAGRLRALQGLHAHIGIQPHPLDVLDVAGKGLFFTAHLGDGVLDAARAQGVDGGLIRFHGILKIRHERPPGD